VAGFSDLEGGGVDLLISISLDLARILERDLTRVGEEEREDGGAGD